MELTRCALITAVIATRFLVLTCTTLDTMTCAAAATPRVLEPGIAFVHTCFAVCLACLVLIAEAVTVVARRTAQAVCMLPHGTVRAAALAHNVFEAALGA